MNSYRSLAISHQLLSLALAALVTTGVLVSLEAKANGQHAAATELAQTLAVPCQQVCLVAQRPVRS